MVNDQVTVTVDRSETAGCNLLTLLASGWAHFFGNSGVTTKRRPQPSGPPLGLVAQHLKSTQKSYRLFAKSHHLLDCDVNRYAPVVTSQLFTA